MVICPSCGSSRTRNDYKPAPIFLRVVGVRALLCDNCNFQFRAFSPVPPKSRRPRHTTRKADVFNSAESVDLGQLSFNESSAERHEPKLTLPMTPKPSQPMQMRQPMQIGLAVATAQSRSGVVVDQIAPVRQDLRTEITKLYAQEAKAELRARLKNEEANSSALTCPECGSHNIKRRKRNLFERVFLSITDHKPYVCRKCETDFYSKSSEQE
ncbi:MAG: hypothetical protein AAB401_14080 [Acidobacteriota bacterium]